MPRPGFTLFVGADRYRRSEAVRRLVAEHLAAGGDVVSLDATEGEAGTILARLREETSTPALTGGRKLVVVTAAPAFWQEAQTFLRELWDRPSPVADVVLVLPALPPGRQPLRERLQRAGALRGFAPLKDRRAPWERPGPAQLEAWVAERARARGLELPPGFAAELCARVGRDAGELEAFLAVLEIRCGRGPVPPSALELAGGRQAARESFALADALLRRDRPEALRLLAAILREGLRVGERRLTRPEEWLPPLEGLLHQRYRRLLELREAEARGEDPAAALGVKPFWVRLWRREAAAHTPAGLREAVAALLAADRRWKREGADPRAVLVDLVLALTAPGEAPR